ncbi:MAG: hypothetical protein PWQ96_276 [Clostridia bacterium]|nr:hypothetical protein [Clostridia bacterium]
MKVIYHCYGGAHSSVTAAAIHLGYLPENRTPSAKEIMQVPLYDKHTDSDHGKIFLFGIDEHNNEIYVVGCRSLGDTFDSILRGIGDIAGIDHSDTILVNTLSAVNWKMRIGGYLSRRLGIIALGRPIVLSGTRSNYQKFVKMVNSVKNHLYNKSVQGGK